MRALTFIFSLGLFFLSTLSWAKSPCKELENAADLLSIKKLKEAYRTNNQKGLGEPIVKLSDYNQARSYVINHPAFSEFGFGKVSKNSLSGWHPYKARNQYSKWQGMNNGWEKKLADGSSARFRLDFEPFDVNRPELGGRAHINMEFFKIKSGNTTENIKLAVDFDCPGKKVCTDDDVLKFVQKINQDL